MLYKQRGSRRWWIRFRDPDGREIRETTGTENRHLAEEYEARRKLEAYRVARLGDTPSHTWQECVVRWLEETRKRSIDDDVYIFRRLDLHLHGLRIADIGPDHVRAITAAMHAEGLKPGRINRVLSLLRAVLRKAEREWRWLDRAPVVAMQTVEPTMPRWLTRDEAARLIAECPRHLAPLVRFSLATGLRESNVCGLEWSHVDLDRRTLTIPPSHAKGKKPITLPLNRDAVVILRGQHGQHPTRVFTYNGKPLAEAHSGAYRRACQRAGLTDINWHTLRHTWASWMIQSGVPLDRLQKLGGWSSLAMVQVYAHLATEHLAEYVEAVSWTNPGTEKKTA